jgi:hypothetical protein
MKNKLKQLIAIVLKFKKWCARNNEWVLHFVITDLIVTTILTVMFAADNLAFALATPVIGILVNFVPEVFLPKSDMKDVAAGSLGGFNAFLRFYAMLLILSWCGLYAL